MPNTASTIFSWIFYFFTFGHAELWKYVHGECDDRRLFISKSNKRNERKSSHNARLSAIHTNVYFISMSIFSGDCVAFYDMRCVPIFKLPKRESCNRFTVFTKKFQTQKHILGTKVNTLYVGAKKGKTMCREHNATDSMNHFTMSRTSD